MSKKVVVLWLCFKMKKVCNSLVAMVHGVFPSRTNG